MCPVLQNHCGVEGRVGQGETHEDRDRVRENDSKTNGDLSFVELKIVEPNNQKYSNQDFPGTKSLKNLEQAATIIRQFFV